MVLLYLQLIVLPQIYGEELLLQNPSQPDLEEITTMITRNLVKPVMKKAGIG